ncbi:hypothetical protein HPB47_011788 [Ixodes persulcatus]|uniref:Uncharacterized protein n=1 Tax=Ixodes persulcatus TaxID=34615 RepID=A0AC60NVB9_IXOPE|nr:hypothetical protein HPB47_011788 [Ixodes persulcatus]
MGGRASAAFARKGVPWAAPDAAAGVQGSDDAHRTAFPDCPGENWTRQRRSGRVSPRPGRTRATRADAGPGSVRPLRRQRIVSYPLVAPVTRLSSATRSRFHPYMQACREGHVTERKRMIGPVIA